MGKQVIKYKVKPSSHWETNPMDPREIPSPVCTYIYPPSLARRPSQPPLDKQPPRAHLGAPGCGLEESTRVVGEERGTRAKVRHTDNRTEGQTDTQTDKEGGRGRSKTDGHLRGEEQKHKWSLLIAPGGHLPPTAELYHPWGHDRVD